jgi:hypothetical protein
MHFIFIRHLHLQIMFFQKNPGTIEHNENMHLSMHTISEIYIHKLSNICLRLLIESSSIPT